jgi:hypothetical protein
LSRSGRLPFLVNSFGDLKGFVVESAVFGIEVTQRMGKMVRHPKEGFQLDYSEIPFRLQVLESA